MFVLSVLEAPNTKTNANILAVACLGTTQPRGPEGPPWNAIFTDGNLKLSFFLTGVQLGQYRTTDKLEDKQYCYRYVRWFISILLC